MISGGSSRRSASAPGPTMSGARTGNRVVQLTDVLDVGPVFGIVAGSAREPAVEDFAEQRLGGRSQAERQHVCVVPRARATGGLGVAAQRGPHTRDLVGGDRGARPGPA